MKKLNLTISILITLAAGTTLALPEKSNSQRVDFTHKIKSARSDQKDLLKNFQAEITTEEINTPDQQEVIEFLNSEIRWNAPKSNAKND